MPAPPPDKPKRGQRERRMLAEWLADRYPDAEVWQQVKLGAYQSAFGNENLTQSEQRYVGVFRRYADALVFTPSKLILIEASIPPKPGYISQLKLYHSLVPLTPELGNYRQLPIEMVYLVAFEDPVVTALARREGILVEVFRPQWVSDYIAELEANKRTPIRSGGL
jgi:hypothetical protein